jgi:Mn-containing catalase
MDIATEEIGHVEMIATMVARLLEGAPATATTQAAAADPVVGAVLGGMDPQQAIVAGGGALPVLTAFPVTPVTTTARATPRAGRQPRGEPHSR